MLIPATGGWRTLLIVVGIVLIVGAAALILAALAAARRQQVTVSLDEDGYRVDGAGGVRQGQWSDVTRVTASTGRITLHQGDDERVHLVSSAGQVPELDAIAQAISARLDDNRGYQVWAG